MTRLPRLGGRELVRFLKERGFDVVRIRGSYFFLAREERRTTDRLIDDIKSDAVRPFHKLGEARIELR